MYHQCPSLTVRNLTGVGLFIWKSFQGGSITPRSEVTEVYSGGGGGEKRIPVKDNVDAEIQIDEGSESLNIQLDGVWKPFPSISILSGSWPISIS